MNVSILRKAIEAQDAKRIVAQAVSDAAGLEERQRDEIFRLLGVAYLLAEEGEEPDARRIKEYIRAIIFAEESQRYYNK